MAEETKNDPEESATTGELDQTKVADESDKIEAVDEPAQPDVPVDESTTEVNRSVLAPKPVPTIAIFVIALLIIIFLLSIVLNVTFLFNSDQTLALSTFNWVVVTSSLLVAGLGLGISFWIYYAKSVYLKDGPALVPERWGHILAELGHITSKANTNTIQSLTAVLEASQYQTEKSESLLESFLTLQQAISNRDDEISRLRKGYDAKIFKKFVTRFIRVSIALEEIREESESTDQSKNYKYLCRLIQNALEDCGVVQVIPEINSDYREAGPEVADDPTLLDTNDPSLNYKITSVKSPAYIIEGEGDREILIPAKVSIYKIVEQKGVNND